jgi:hypothetical protein
MTIAAGLNEIWGTMAHDVSTWTLHDGSLILAFKKSSVLQCAKGKVAFIHRFRLLPLGWKKENRCVRLGSLDMVFNLESLNWHFNYKGEF